ncbi:MAG TPA: hypothetical protein VJQ52_01825, partial [Steroidobacteraceae bacterium]|nr:hypothetical protein [Steroidobacteraceae bacterium]
MSSTSPADLDPADELIVESVGFKDTTWLDFGGHPHSESLRITERYRRTDLGHIKRQVTLTDPEAFARPIVVDSDMILTADTELLEYVCAETPRERFALAGRTESEKQVKVPVAVLDKYVGGRRTLEASSLACTHQRRDRPVLARPERVDPLLHALAKLRVIPIVP